MKKIVIAVIACMVFLLCTTVNVSAQTPDTVLSFSRVVLYNIAANDTSAISVPSGRVWKIESVSMGSSGSAAGVFLKTGNQKIAFFASPASTASASFPYWLPAGYTGSFVNNNPSYRCSVSITEYIKMPDN